ncbi:iron-siderophore ABC transporter substrate-binding protein [Lipingzhangella sp. LS1_29]|uniref:Iron-siderophore ABC transporter substrate-binding protein n=1 Tax=Lipingzhangella rawalii TaxID=2055835 RepID=A0ABU2H7K7_9ACTN|nr:iron-siderophore ABC transporter substrate-binding protein [Lipingzhangella rawalii]MDS1270589.1 iron-siderophore ABC transporter substrate-binding protein [Lipingzhangella rawalii]
MSAGRSARHTPAGWTCGIALGGIVILTGCGDGAGGAADENGGAGGEGFPVTVEHAFGSTEIPAEPETVVTLGWADADTALALGHPPAGVAEGTYGGDEDGHHPWTRAEYEEQGEELPELINIDEGVQIEEVGALAPDLILGIQSGLTEQEYDDLSQIAPTVPYPDEPWLTEWQEMTRMVGASLGKPEEAEELVSETEDLVTDLAVDNPQFNDLSYATGTLVEGQQFGFFIGDDVRPQLMEELGFTPSDISEELAVEDEGFYGTLSLENADQIDADVLVMWYESAEQQEQAEENAVFQQIPAVEDGRYLGIVDRPASTAISTPSPVSIPWVLPDFVADLQELTQEAD